MAARIKLLKYGANGAAFLLFAYFIFKFRGDFGVILEISAAQFLLLFLLTFFTVIANGVKLRLLALHFDLRLSFKEWFGLTAITFSLNSLFFKTGSVISSNYLKRKYGFPYMTYAGAFGGDQLIVLFLSALIGGASSFLMSAANFQVARGIAVFFLLVSAALLLAAALPRGAAAGRHILLNAAARAFASLKAIVSDRQLLFSLGVYSLIGFALMAGRLYVACAVLRVDFSALHCLLFVAIAVFVRFLPLLQGDLGSRELAVGLISEMLGTGMKEGVMITAFDRIFMLGWTLLFSLLVRNMLFFARPGGVEKG